MLVSGRVIYEYYLNDENRLPSLKLTAKAPENGWLEYDCFLLGQFRPIFRCKLAVSFREYKKFPTYPWIIPDAQAGFYFLSWGFGGSLRYAPGVGFLLERWVLNL